MRKLLLKISNKIKNNKLIKCLIVIFNLCKAIMYSKFRYINIKIGNNKYNMEIRVLLFSNFT